MQAKMDEKFKWLLTSLVVLTLLVNVFTLVSYANRPVEVNVEIPTAEEIASLIVIPTTNETAVFEVVTDIQSTLNEEDDWKSEAKLLAEDEWSYRNYKDVYNAIDDIFGDIDEREDINKVVVKDSKVTSFNVDDKDATVVQKLKVYYEDVNGDDKKVYLVVETIIKDYEVEDQDFEED